MVLLMALLVAFISTVVVLLSEVFATEKRPITVGLITFVLSVLLNMSIIYLGNPYFTHWLTGGYPLLFFLDVAIGFFVSLFTSAGNGNHAGGTIRLGFILVGTLFVWFCIQIAAPRGLPCDNGSYKDLARLLRVQDVSDPYPNTDPDKLLRVGPKTALLTASRTIGGEANLGAYLQPNRAYLQQVGGHEYYIVDLMVVDNNAFRNLGSVIPGYIVVDAQDPNKPGELRLGYKMRYVPGAGSLQNGLNYELDRHAYLNFLLGTPWQVDDLDGLEVDDNWNPYYTGTLLRPAVGFYGYAVDGMITVDPQNGQIDYYDLAHTPIWNDRIYSESLVHDYATWWGSYAFRDPCPPWYQGSAGERKVDAINYVATAEGLMYQVTMTSPNSDQSLTEMLYVNPKTGVSKRYPITGAHEIGITHLAEEKSHTINAQGYDADQCQIQRLLNHNVWFCILEGKGGSNSASAGAFAGVFFVEEHHSSNNTDAIAEADLSVAYAKLRRQIANDESSNPVLAKNAQIVQLSGVVDRKGASGKDFILFTIKGKDIPINVVFRVDSSDVVAILMKEGDTVTVTAQEVKFDSVTDVVSIDDQNIPSFVKKAS